MNWHEDKTMIVLSFFIIFFTAAALLALWWLPNDAVVWQLFSGAITSFIGALSLHLRGDKPSPPALPHGSVASTASTTTTITEVKPEKVEAKPDGVV